MAVYYRGQNCTGADGCAEVQLPDYFEALTRPEGRTVLVTSVTDGGLATPLAVSPVTNSAFVVRCADGSRTQQRFFWEVKAIRADIEALTIEVAKPSRLSSPDSSANTGNTGSP